MLLEYRNVRKEVTPDRIGNFTFYIMKSFFCHSYLSSLNHNDGGRGSDNEKRQVEKWTRGITGLFLGEIY